MVESLISSLLYTIILFEDVNLYFEKAKMRLFRYMYNKSIKQWPKGILE